MPTLSSPSQTALPTERPLRIAFGIFVASIAFSVLGLLLLRLVPSSLELFGPYYVALVKAPTWVYMALLPILAVLMYGPTLGLRRTAFFLVWGSVIGAASELFGTMTGFPFGEYFYGHWLGPKIAGHVPYFIPFSWFALSIASYDLAGRVTRGAWGRVLVGTLFMVLWDVALDPAMSAAFTFWSYPNGGFFYGMPLSNWGGWLFVSLVIVAGYEFLGGGLPTPSRWAPLFYGLNGLFPLLISAIQGLEGAAVVGAVAIALPIAWARYAERPAGRPAPGAPPA